MKRQREKLIERDVKLALGKDPGIWLHQNVVSEGYDAGARDDLARALKHMPTAAKIVEAVLMRHRQSFGMGVGSPDLLVAVDGWCTWQELKTEEGRVEPEQARWHEMARTRGMTVNVVRSAQDAVDAVAAVRARRGR